MKLGGRPKVVNKVVLLPVEEIHPSPYQPRRYFGEEGLDSLGRSIAQNGLLSPIIVRKDEEGGYQLIAGERRLMACRRLGQWEIPAIVQEKDDLSAAVLTLIENLHRENLSFFEEAEGIYQLIQESGLSQQKICAVLDMAQPTVANKLRLLRLSPAVRDTVEELGLTERIARALLRLEGEERQLKACRYIAAHHLTSAQGESYIARLAEEQGRRNRPSGHLRDYRLIFSTMDKAVAQLKEAGIPVKTEKSEEEDCVCYTVRVPKAKTAKKRSQTVAV